MCLVLRRERLGAAFLWDFNGMLTLRCHLTWLGYLYYPLVNIQTAIEHGHLEIVDFPINSTVIFHSYVYVYQRVWKTIVNLPIFKMVDLSIAICKRSPGRVIEVFFAGEVIEGITFVPA